MAIIRWVCPTCKGEYTVPDNLIGGFFCPRDHTYAIQTQSVPDALIPSQADLDADRQAEQDAAQRVADDQLKAEADQAAKLIAEEKIATDAKALQDAQVTLTQTTQTDAVAVAAAGGVTNGSTSNNS